MIRGIKSTYNILLLNLWSSAMTRNSRIMSETSGTMAEHSTTMADHAISIAEHSTSMTEHSTTMADNSRILEENGLFEEPGLIFFNVLYSLWSLDILYFFYKQTVAKYGLVSWFALFVLSYSKYLIYNLG